MAADRKVRLIIEVDDKDVEAAEKSLDRLGMSAKKVDAASDSMDKFSGSMTGASFAGNLLADVVQRVPELAIAAAKGLWNLAEGSANYAVNLEKARQVTGLHLDALAGLELQARRSKISFDDIGEGMKEFTRLIGEANNGSKDAVAKMARLGIEPVKAAKDLDGAFRDVIKTIVAQRNEVSQSNAAMDAFGETGYKLLPFLKSFDGDLDQLTRRAKELGLTLSGENVQQAKEFEKSLADVKDRAIALGITFGQTLGPAIKDTLDDANQWMRENKAEVKGWADSIVYALTRVGQELKVVGFLAERTQLLMDWDWTGGMVDGAEAHAKWQQKWDDLETRIAANDISIEKTRLGQPNPRAWQINEEDDYQLYLQGKLPYNTGEYFRPEEKKAKKVSAPKVPAGGEPAMRRFFEEELGFRVNRTFGRAINTGSMHPAGKAIDVAHNGVPENELVRRIALAIEKGYQFVDERVKRKGIKQTGPHLHFEKDPDDPSSFLDASFYGGERNLAYLKAIDAKRLGKGGGTSGSLGEDVGKVMSQQSDQLTKEYRESLLDDIIEMYSKLGIIPDGKMLTDITRRLADRARQEGVRQPDSGDVLSAFRIAQAERATEIASTDPTVGGNVRMQAMTLMPGEQYVKNLRESLGLEKGINGELSRGAQLIARKSVIEQEISTRLEDQRQTRDEINHELEIELELMRRGDIFAEARNRGLQQEVYISREIRELQVEIMNLGRNDQLVRERDYLQDILTIERSRAEISRGMEVSTERVLAGMYEHMAQQKTLNEGIVDGFRGTYDSLLRLMNEPLDKLNQKAKGLLSIFTEPLKAMQAQGLNSLFTGILDKVFPGMGSQMEKAKNPVVGELKDHTKLLEQIAKNTGGMPVGYRPTTTGGAGSILTSIFGGGGSGTGPGGTPWFNPSAGGQSTNPLDGINIGTGGFDPRTGQYSNAGGSGGGFGSILSGLGGGLGGLFKGRKNLLTGKVSGMAGTLGGIGDIASMAGGMIGGRWGNLISMAGMGASIGANFGPWGAAIGAGIGGVAGLVMALFGGDNANKKIKEAALSQYGITIKDKSVLNSLKQLGEQYFGKGKVGANAVQLVQTDEAKNILRNYAEATGQSGAKIDILSHGDENWSGNQFRGRFGGYRAMGGSVRAGYDYVVGERGPEMIRMHRDATVIPAHQTAAMMNGQNIGGDRIIQVLGQLEETMNMFASRLDSISAGEMLRMGVQENPRAVRDGYERELHADPRSTRSLNELTGSII